MICSSGNATEAAHVHQATCFAVRGVQIVHISRMKSFSGSEAKQSDIPKV